jgi:hypothetical protein
MAKNRIKEDIDYGDTPERMDPSLERKISDPQSPFAINPAFVRAEKDVQRLMTNRFKQVADKLREVTGRPITSVQVAMMIYQQQLQNLQTIMGIERRHKEQLESLAVEAALDEIQMPSDWFEINAQLGPFESPEFNLGGGGTPPEMSVGEEMDVSSEMHKRNLINAIIQGTAKKGHYVFQKPEIRRQLDEIDPRLYPAYLGIMTINDFMYFSMEQMIEMMSSSASGIGGAVQLKDSDNDENDEDGDGAPDTVINAYGLIFPILCHEVIKGLEESKGRYGDPEDAEVRQIVQQKTDTLPMESWTLRLGPEIVEKIRFALPDEVFDEDNYGLINWFQMELYKLPAEDFIKIIGNAISEDSSKQSKAKESFKDVLKVAKQNKEEYEGFEDVSPKDDGDDDGLDFLAGLGISRPK